MTTIPISYFPLYYYASSTMSSYFNRNSDNKTNAPTPNIKKETILEQRNRIKMQQQQRFRRKQEKLQLLEHKTQIRIQKRMIKHEAFNKTCNQTESLNLYTLKRAIYMSRKPKSITDIIENLSTNELEEALNYLEQYGSNKTRDCIKDELTNSLTWLTTEHNY